MGKFHVRVLHESSRGGVSEEVSYEAGICEWEATTNEAKVIWIMRRDAMPKPLKALPALECEHHCAPALMFAQEICIFKASTFPFCVPGERCVSRSMEKRKISEREIIQFPFFISAAIAKLFSPFCSMKKFSIAASESDGKSPACEQWELISWNGFSSAQITLRPLRRLNNKNSIGFVRLKFIKVDELSSGRRARSRWQPINICFFNQ